MQKKKHKKFYRKFCPTVYQHENIFLIYVKIYGPQNAFFIPLTKNM